jgi:hypothetical protein
VVEEAVEKPHFSQKKREMGHPKFQLIQMWATRRAVVTNEHEAEDRGAHSSKPRRVGQPRL